MDTRDLAPSHESLYAMRRPATLPPILAAAADTLGLRPSLLLSGRVEVEEFASLWRRRCCHVLVVTRAEGANRVITLRRGPPSGSLRTGWAGATGWACVEAVAGCVAIPQALRALASLVANEERLAHPEPGAIANQSIETWLLCLTLALALLWHFDPRLVLLQQLAETGGNLDCAPTQALLAMAQSTHIDFADIEELSRYARTHFALRTATDIATAAVHAGNHRRIVELARYLSQGLALPARARQCRNVTYP